MTCERMVPVRSKRQCRHVGDCLPNVFSGRPLVSEAQPLDAGKRFADFRRIFAIDVLRPHGIAGLSVLEHVADFHFDGERESDHRLSVNYQLASRVAGASPEEAAVRIAINLLDQHGELPIRCQRLIRCKITPWVYASSAFSKRRDGSEITTLGTWSTISTNS